MLHTAKLVKVIAQMADQLFIDRSQEYSLVHDTWQLLVRDPLIKEKLKSIQTPWNIPVCYNSLDQAVPIALNVSDYTIMSVDGSQVYPDRHQNISCFLINIGTVILKYQSKGASAVTLDSFPSVWTHEMIPVRANTYGSIDIVNAIRQEYEFLHGLQIVEQDQEQSADQLVVFDGSLIFWHLESKEVQLKEYFLRRYVQCLNDFYEKRILFCSYISAPKAKDITYIVRTALLAGLYGTTVSADLLSSIVDLNIVQKIISPGYRTTIFKSQVSIATEYPPALHPHFFYVHVGSEIVRVEVPAWIGENEEKVNTIAALLYDQVQKGYGYPVALSEAHEQAVVHAADRDLFYYLLQKTAQEKKIPRATISAKLMRKKQAGF